MSGIFFTNLALLGGLAALSIPILIHLLLKRKKQRLRFSTLQFFLKQDEQSSRRRKFRNWLLLAMRILLLTLIVLAFARPYLPNQFTNLVTQKRHQIVFLLDRSASMQANDADGVRWMRAKHSIEKILSELKQEDRVALVGCSTQTDVLSPLAPPAEVARVLNNLTPDFGTSDLGESLQQATRILSAKNSIASSTIYVVSDLQRNGCRKLTAPVPQSVEIKFLNVGDPFTPNTSVAEIQLETAGSSRSHAVIANFSDGNTKVKATLLVDGKEIFSRDADLKPDASTQIELPVPPLAPGWHETEFRIQSNDALALDNTRYDAIYISQPARVLVVEPRETKRVFEEESFFITSALEPAKGVQASLPRFTIEKIAAGELTKKLSTQKSESRYDFVVLPGLREIPSGASKALSEFVQAGGGLLFFLGDSVSANRYNSEFRELLPAQLGRIEGSLLNWHLDNYEKSSAIFAAFQRPNSGNLNLPEFTHRFTLTADQNARVLAQFDDGVALVIQSADGRIILVNTSADTRWNDWPKHKTFVPWLHSVGNYLAGNQKVDQIKMSLQLTPSDDADIDLGVGAKQNLFRVQRSGGKEVSVTSDEQGHLRNVNLGIPGVYSIRNQSGQELQRFAVNLPTEESDLTAMTTNQFQQQIVRSSDAAQPVLAAGLFGQETNQKEFWRVLLIAGLVLLVLELVLANRTFA